MSMLLHHQASSASNGSCTIPSNTRNNTLVAESDYNAALAALQNKFHQIINSNNENRTTVISATNPGKYNDEHDNDNAVLHRLLMDCSNSLVHQIQTITQPVSDEAYHTYVSQYKENCSLRIPHVDRNADKSVSKVDKEMQDVNDVVFSEEELLDHNAYVRVQELRQLVREKANTVLQLRQKSIQRAITITDRQVQMILHDNEHQDQHGGTVRRMLDDGTKTNAELMQQHYNALHQMKESLVQLQQLSSSITNVKLIQDYKTTISTIHDGLHTNGTSSSSNTAHNHNAIERAIYRRDYYIPSKQQQQIKNDGIDPTTMVDGVTTTTTSNINMDPENLISNLLCRRY